MSGHSKWATTKRAKAVVDAKRGAVFTKLGNLISIAARKGSDPNLNFALAQAMARAREVNMPKDNIERAIKRGTGEGGGVQIEELIYEAIGPAQSQFIIRVLTDNRNRAAANIRHLLTKHGGSLGATLWNFEHKGVILIAEKIWEESQLKWDDFALELIDLGIDDLKHETEGIIIYTKPEALMNLKKWLSNKNLNIESAEVEYVAKEKKTLTQVDKEKFEQFIEALEDNEDVSDYFTNVEQ